MKRRALLAATLGAGILAGAAGSTRAATEKPFTQATFAAAQKAGKPILVHVWASWCPTCKAQAPTLAAIEADPANKDLLVLKVNFDDQKDVVNAFGVRMQSTLIAFRGTKEEGRSTGDTDPGSIKALVAKAVQ
ncbi:MAG: thioredoxin family protein [Proteobacteria bacterium]|nr:thioredoxin family protein [Pseudomonadota bacterium]